MSDRISSPYGATSPIVATSTIGPFPDRREYPYDACGVGCSPEPAGPTRLLGGEMDDVVVTMGDLPAPFSRNPRVAKAVRR